MRPTAIQSPTGKIYEAKHRPYKAQRAKYTRPNIGHTKAKHRPYKAQRAKYTRPNKGHTKIIKRAMKQEANGCGKAYKTKKQDANYPVQRLKAKGTHGQRPHRCFSNLGKYRETPLLCWDVHSYSRQYRAYWTV